MLCFLSSNKFLGSGETGGRQLFDGPAIDGTGYTAVILDGWELII
jgi:hypothetical protein